MNSNPELSFFRRVLQLASLTVQHIAITISCGLLFLLVCIAFTRLNPWLELAVHFAVHALVATLVVIPILWFTAHRRTAIVCCFMALCFAFLVQPWYLLPWSGSTRPNELRVLSWNVLATNEEFDSIVAFIREVDPDILVLIEMRPDLPSRAPWIAEHFPVSKQIPVWGGGGIAVYCRTDAKDYQVEFEVQNFVTRVMPTIVTKITNAQGDRQVELVAMHTFSPTPPQRALLRDKQIRKFLEWSGERDKPLCLVGDLNTTPWTQSFWELERAGFRDSRRGSGNSASWPAWLGAAGIPIDHALTRGECTITNRRVHTVDAGSDHRPIEFTLSY